MTTEQGSRVELTEPEIRDRIRGFVQESLSMTDGDTFDDDAPLLQGRLDSLALMELLTFIEDAFGVAVDPDDIDELHFGTIDRVARLVVARTQRA
jgi:acyl carrier protein